MLQPRNAWHVPALPDLPHISYFTASGGRQTPPRSGRGAGGARLRDGTAGVSTAYRRRDRHAQRRPPSGTLIAISPRSESRSHRRQRSSRTVPTSTPCLLAIAWAAASTVSL